MKGDSQQFKFDYRPVIATYAAYCIWQGLAWLLEPSERFTAPVWTVLRGWTESAGFSINDWGFPIFLSGLLILIGMVIRKWQVRWIGYAIASLVFLTIAESMRASGIIFENATQTGFRTYVFVGFLPIVLATVAFVHAKERTERRGSP